MGSLFNRLSGGKSENATSDGTLLYIIDRYSDEDGWFYTLTKLGKLAFLVSQETDYVQDLSFEVRNYGPYPTDLSTIMRNYEEQDMIYIREKRTRRGSKREDYRIRQKGRGKN